MKRLKPEISLAQAFAEADNSRTQDSGAAEGDGQRPGLLARVSAEIRTIWEISSHGHTHGSGPGQHRH